MRKLVFSVVAIAMLATSALFAQEESSVSRRLGFYLSANAGDMIADQIFSDNQEFEVGGTYSQNFAGAEWMTFAFTALWVTKQKKVYDNGDTLLGQVTGNLTDEENGSPRAKLALTFNGSGFGADGLAIGVAMDTRTRFDLGVGYSLAAGPGRLSMGLYTETYLLARMSGATNDEDNKHYYAGNLDGAVFLETAYVQVGYGVPLNQTFGFNTTVYARFLDPINKMPDGDWFELRLDANLTANFSGLGLWAGVRFDLEGLTVDKVDPDLSLRGGVSYSFSL